MGIVAANVQPASATRAARLMSWWYETNFTGGIGLRLSYYPRSDLGKGLKKALGMGMEADMAVRVKSLRVLFERPHDVSPVPRS